MPSSFVTRATSDSPSPSMSIARREAKWVSRPSTCAGQVGLGQEMKISSATTAEPHAGQWVGRANGVLPSVWATDATTEG